MMRQLLLSFCVALLFFSFVVVCTADPDDNSDGTNRDKRFFSMFQVVTFANDVCEGDDDDRNGTCYTSGECENRGGKEIGSCADGFGVCCAFTLECGDTSSQNLTYLVEDDFTHAEVGPSCVYSICRSDEDVCRIRLDFVTFVLAAPVEGTTQETNAEDQLNSGAVGDCATDAFAVSSPGGVGTPVICGINTGQHMFVDASGDGCHTAAFAIGSASNIVRQWDVTVTQYACGSEDGGPQGCLQYFTGVQNTISSYNFPTSGPITASTTHLSNQFYTICIRRESGYCAICYSNTHDGVDNTPENQGSFGLSVSPSKDPDAGFGAHCSSDYIRIPGPYVGDPSVAAVDVGRLCGRHLNVEEKADAGVTVCSQTLPFRVVFHTDGDELVESTTPDGPDEIEQEEGPGGIVGFSIDYVQQRC